MAFPDVSIPHPSSPPSALGGLWVLGDVEAVIARPRVDGANPDITVPSGEPVAIDRPAGHSDAPARWSLLDEHLDD